MAAANKGPLHPSTGHNVPMKTIEEMYQKKSQLEHILLRPDTYVGSVEKHTQTLWVYENGEMVQRLVTYVPGLYKIFDEILVNAADNKQRDPKMDSVKVDIHVEGNRISVYNSGDGIPVEIHAEEKVYVPELIFGHLLTSSNYDDGEKKTTGGRNGYGAKLTNIFSTEFIIETSDGKRLRKYKQVFSNNMSKKGEPEIVKCKSSENWTRVTFKPDLAKFGMECLEEDVVALMKKRVVDLAGTLGKSVKVELNGKRVPVKSFTDYADLCLASASKYRPEPLPSVMEKVNDRWEICVSLSDGQFQQVSFVNGIATTQGGTHVDYVTNQIANHVMNIVNKKNKNALLKAHDVKSHLWVFVNSLINNPAFDSQTKETLTTCQNSFGTKCELSEDFLKRVAKSGIVTNLLTRAAFRVSKELKKTDGTKRQRITGIPKLEDANEAGGRNSDKCTLILTEGDSAKALAMAGISVIGRNYYGVFPLRGKLLNVREASHKQIMDNTEIQNIKQILGLHHGKEYDSTKGLRYGHLMIMTDQDHDGSHIKGLLINFIHNFWPSLLKIPSFLVEFITPIVKASNSRTKTVFAFYSMPEYENWKESLGANASAWSIKYYKGLGTSTSKEGKEYFQAIDKHKKYFMWSGEQDGDAIELAFSRKKIEQRKNWLRQLEPGTFLDQTEKSVKYSDFVNKELILFSMADLQRSIPSMVDGFKPGQRKVLFCSFKRNFVKEAKVAQFSGYVSQHSAYHHGEANVAGTIIGMAQDFVGSNNINLLQPNGQFGTRHQGGKDHASARYVYTKLSPITRFLFPKDDDMLLDYLNEDEQSIEPSWYMPIIPMVLVNGSEGIGTGWSCYIPNYNPRDIVANIRNLLNKEPMEPMHPWYRGFKGSIEKTSAKESGVTYTLTGIIEELDDTTLRITELPIRRWTQDYKEFLEASMLGTDKIKEPFIKDYREHNDDVSVHFEVILTEENMNMALKEGLEKKFNLTTSIGTTNMHLFDANGIIKKYDNPEQILEDFFHLRLEFYVKRKKVLLDNLELDLLRVDNKVRFILGVVNNEIKVHNRKRAELFQELHDKGFTPFPKKTKAKATLEEIDENEEAPVEEVVVKGAVKASDYEYLLSMAIGTLTLEKVQELCGEREKLEAEVVELRKSTPHSLWSKDLDALEKELDELDRNDVESEIARKVMRAKNGQSTTGTSAPAREGQVNEETCTAVPEETKKRGPAKKKATVIETDEEDEILEMDFHSLARKDLQALCKKNKIPANISNMAMADALKSLKSIEWDDEVIQKLSPNTGTRRVQKKPEEPALLQTPATRTKRTAVKKAAETNAEVPIPKSTVKTTRQSTRKPVESVKSARLTRNTGKMMSLDQDEIATTETDLAPLKEVETTETEVAPLKEVEAVETEVSPLKQVEPTETEVAPLKEVEDIETEVSPLKQVEDIETEVAPFKEIETTETTETTETETASLKEVEAIETEIVALKEVEIVETEITEIVESILYVFLPQLQTELENAISVLSIENSNEEVNNEENIEMVEELINETPDQKELLEESIEIVATEITEIVESILYVFLPQLQTELENAISVLSIENSNEEVNNEENIEMVEELINETPDQKELLEESIENSKESAQNDLTIDSPIMGIVYEESEIEANQEDASTYSADITFNASSIEISTGEDKEVNLSGEIQILSPVRPLAEADHSVDRMIDSVVRHFEKASIQDENKVAMVVEKEVNLKDTSLRKLKAIYKEKLTDLNNAGDKRVEGRRMALAELNENQIV